MRAESPIIRHESPDDQRAIAEVVRSAFGRDDESNLIDALREGGFARLSLVAVMRDRIVGHILFSDFTIDVGDRSIPALALAPLAVAADFQRRGIGSELVRRGLEACRELEVRGVFVLGHPEFYPRFGFSAELARPIHAPFSGPAWMALETTTRSLGGVSGTAHYPAPFGLE